VVTAAFAFRIGMPNVAPLAKFSSKIQAVSKKFYNRPERVAKENKPPRRSFTGRSSRNPSKTSTKGKHSSSQIKTNGKKNPVEKKSSDRTKGAVGKKGVQQTKKGLGKRSPVKAIKDFLKKVHAKQKLPKYNENANSTPNYKNYEKLKFGKKDIVFGLIGPGKATGHLEKFAKMTGANSYSSFKSFTKNPNAKSPQEKSVQLLSRAAKSSRQVRFDLTGIKGMKKLLANKGEYKNKVTSHELRYIKKNWNSFKLEPKFYQNGKEVRRPW